MWFCILITIAGCWQYEKKAKLWAGEILDNLDLSVGYPGAMKALGGANPMLIKHQKVKKDVDLDIVGGRWFAQTL